MNDQQFRLFPFILLSSEKESLEKASPNGMPKIYKIKFKKISLKNPEYKTRQDRWHVFFREQVFFFCAPHTHVFILFSGCIVWLSVPGLAVTSPDSRYRNKSSLNTNVYL